MNKDKKVKEFNTPNTTFGSGDNYGSGIKQKTGKMISSWMDGSTKNVKSKPPRALA